MVLPGAEEERRGVYGGLVRAGGGRRNGADRKEGPWPGLARHGPRRVGQAGELALQKSETQSIGIG